MPHADLCSRIDALPTEPGVYLFKDRDGVVIYIGKALSLRARVRQYLAGQDERPMIPTLVRAIADLEIVLTRTEKEALILESTLVKKFRPRFNVKLRDDKNFLHLRIHPKDDWPRFVMVRRIRGDGARHFGPYHSAQRARMTMDQLQRTFPLRSCDDSAFRNRSRPCILHQMHRCPGPCVGLADRVAYHQAVDEAMLFLEGRSRDVLARLTDRMSEHAEAERFEEAALLRDRIQAIQSTVERQQVVDRRLGDRDVWGLYREADKGVALVLPVREGAMQEPVVLRFERAAEEDDELLSNLLMRHYDPGGDGDSWIPPEILLPSVPSAKDGLEELLQDRRGARVHIAVPLQGDKRQILDLAARNARERHVQAHDEDARRAQALEALARVCQLEAPPHRIECFDNSNLQGTDPVASMVVFIDGRPDRAAYRRYKVRTVEGPDDYATMREILGRRFRRIEKDGVRPDLVVVDGGRGQVSVVQAILAELGYADQPLIGLAKPHTEHARGERDALDKIVLPEIRDPVHLKARNPALRLLQHLRDESHAWAVRFHRKVRSRRNLESVLEEIPGIGPARRKALMERFGSARAVAEADVGALAEVEGLGPALAQKVWEVLHPEG